MQGRQYRKKLHVKDCESAHRNRERERECVCVRACMCLCVCVCARARVRACLRGVVRECVFSAEENNEHKQVWLKPNKCTELQSGHRSMDPDPHAARRHTLLQLWCLDKENLPGGRRTHGLLNSLFSSLLCSFTPTRGADPP